MRHVQLLIEEWPQKVRISNPPQFDLFVEEVYIGLGLYTRTRAVVNIPTTSVFHAREHISKLPTKIYYDYLKSIIK